LIKIFRYKYDWREYYLKLKMGESEYITEYQSVTRKGIFGDARILYCIILN